MNVVLWIMFGALVGWIGSMLMNTRTEREGLQVVLLGVLGGITGGWATITFARSTANDFNLYSVLAAVLGSMVALMVKVRTSGPPRP